MKSTVHTLITAAWEEMSKREVRNETKLFVQIYDERFVNLKCRNTLHL